MQIPKQESSHLIKRQEAGTFFFFFFFIPGTLFLYKTHLEALIMGSRNDPYRKSGAVIRV